MDTKKALIRLANLVKNSRAEMGMTYREYGKLFGNLNPSVSNLEKANFINLPSHETLIKFAEIIRMPYWRLIKYLEYGETEDNHLPESLTKVQIISGVKQIRDFDDLLDIDWEVAVQKERIRHSLPRQNSQDKGA